MAGKQENLDRRSAALTVLAVAMLAAMTIAWRVDAIAAAAPPIQTYQLQIVDEFGAPVSGATLTAAGQQTTTDASGLATFELKAAELVVVEAPGSISDAIVIGTPDRPQTTLRLLAAIGPGGERTVMHFGGDFMMGRRYVEPTRLGTPVVEDEDSARAVVADIAPLFSLADLVSVNFESVIGSLASDESYPGKQYVIQSARETLAALDELGVNLVSLGNNHINDWRDDGVAATIRHLGDADIAHPGAGVTASDAFQPALITAGSIKVGVVSMTTLSGDNDNHRLPDATVPIPATADPEHAWQYETRRFGFGEPGDPDYIEPADRRPAAIWRLFDQLEPNLTEAATAELWKQISEVYPQLQDWVARRGHGGAALYSPDAVEKSIATARSAGADLVVVQLHGGQPYAELPSGYFKRAARSAVDAGANLVIGHHPHVVQGFEFYNDALIAYSLGNIVFDQDFLVSHPSIVLRTVFEGEELVAATAYPVVLNNYRPVAVGGEAASRIIRQINEASIQSAEAIRLPDLTVTSRLTTSPATASVIDDNGRGQIVALPDPTPMTVEILAADPIEVPSVLVAIDEATTGLRIGRDLFGFGNLEEIQADAEAGGGLEWVVPRHSMEVDTASPAGPWTVRLDRTSRDDSDAVARIAARVPLPAHRWFSDDAVALDGNATYSAHVWARREGAGIPFVRVAYYESGDATETIDVQLPLVNDGSWHELWVDLPLPPNAADAALIGVGLPPPESGSGTVWIDGFEVIEWRRADQLPEDIWVPADYVTAASDRTVTLTTR